MDDELALDAGRTRRNHDTGVVRDRDAIPVGGEADRMAQVGQLPLPPRHGDALGDEPLGGRHRLVELVDAAEQRPELEAAEHLLQLGTIGWSQHERRRVEVEIEVAPHRCELLRDARLVGVLGDVLPARRRELLGVRDHLLERAVLGDQLAAVLSPIPGTPGMLSEVSPLSPMKSGTWSGRTP